MGIEGKVVRQARPGPAANGRNRWLLLGTGALLTVCLLAGCFGVAGWAALAALSSEPPFAPAPAAPTFAEIESVARITLPPSARNVQAHQEGFQDRIIWVRFEMAPADLPGFVAGTRVAPPLSSTVNPLGQDTVTGLPWWTPGQAQRFEAGEGAFAGASQAIVIDTTDPQTYVVYVRAFET